MLEVYRAKCSFNLCSNRGHLTVKDAVKTSGAEIRSVPTSPNFLRAANNNPLNLNNKVNQNIQFFSKLCKAIDENPVGSAVKVTTKVNSMDKENECDNKETEDNDAHSEILSPSGSQEKVDQDPSSEADLTQTSRTPSVKYQGSKSDENLVELSKRDEENQLQCLFLGFNEGDLFRVLSKEWTAWWAVRALDTQRRVGFVQAQMLEKADDLDQVEKGETDHVEQIEANLKALEELRKRIGQDDPEGIFSDAMIPEPELMERCNQRNQAGNLGRQLATGGPPLVNSEGLIMPRKPQNPCIESADRQNLHRELLFNQKIGKNVLNQKSELQRALEKHKEHQAKKEVELQRQQSKTAFERALEERARKLESKEKIEEKTSNGSEPEFMKVHAKLKAKMEPK